MLGRARRANAIIKKDADNTIPTSYENHGSLELNSLGIDKDIEEESRFTNITIIVYNLFTKLPFDFEIILTKTKNIVNFVSY